MEALAQAYNGSGLTSGIVRARDGDALLTAGSFGLVRARRAEGCLLQPAPGDTVLLALLDDGNAWAISVLQRADTHACGDVLLPARARLRARELSLNADDLQLSGRTVGLRAGLLTLSGHLLLQGFAAVRTLCRDLKERALRHSGHYGALDEKVDDLAHRAAGRVRSEARTSYRLRAERADIRAAEQVDIDGRHIKVG